MIRRFFFFSIEILTVRKQVAEVGVHITKKVKVEVIVGQTKNKQKGFLSHHSIIISLFPAVRRLN